MPLSINALDALTEEYFRLVREAQDAVAIYQARHDEAQGVATFLRSAGRGVPLPGEMIENPLDTRQRAQEWPFDGRADDATLEGAILRLLPERGGGYKPSEMTTRLTKRGFPFDYQLPERVVRALNAMTELGVVHRGKDGRYRATHDVGIFLTDGSEEGFAG